MKKFTLSNGLRVVIEQIPTFRSVSFGIWVKTGSRNETPDNNGISHFIEHMLFKGTQTRTSQDIADLFDGIGGNVNAFTSKEYTCYFAKVLDQHLPLAVDALADMFFASRFDEEELSKERNVILEEISMYEDTPDDKVHDEASRASFGDHPLAYSILGLEERLRAMTPDTLRNHMKDHYTIDNTVISVAGNIEEEALLELLEKHFDRFQDRGVSTPEPAPEFNGSYLFHKKKTEQNHICLTFPGCSIIDPKLYAMILLNNAIGGGMSSRLFQEIREKRGLAYSVYSYHTSYADTGLFTVYAGTAPKQTKEVLDHTMSIMESLSVSGLSDAELKRGKEQLKGSLILSLESTSSRMNRIGKNELMLGQHHTLDEMIERIEAVSKEDIQDIMAHMLFVPFAVAMVGTNDKAAVELGGIVLFEVQFKKLAGNEDVPLPAKASELAAGFDLHAAIEEQVVLSPGERKLIATGFAMAMPAELEAQIRPRSGLAFKHGITSLNAPGTIDADYRGEVKVLLINHGTEDFTISRGDRIAQMVFQVVPQISIVPVEELSETVRGAGGFGHTGVASLASGSETRA